MAICASFPGRPVESSDWRAAPLPADKEVKAGPKLYVHIYIYITIQKYGKLNPTY